VHIDNVQTYVKQQDQRVWRQNKMIIGMGGTWTPRQLSEREKQAYSYEDKRQRVEKADFCHLTVEKLLGLIDQRHIDQVGCLQWLKSRVNFIPQLHRHKLQIRMLYETQVSKLKLPNTPTDIHPLPFNRRNENVTTDLKAAVLDFLSHISQSRENYQRRVQPIGGDGLTYQRLLKLQNYLAFHENEFETFDLIEPFLEPWHTQWTNICDIHETHWGPEGLSDPSTLGHSARKIGCQAPPNLKKVDYYPACDLVYLVLDARMIDCWWYVT
jgi:hypothetical protein